MEMGTLWDTSVDVTITSPIGPLGAERAWPTGSEMHKDAAAMQPASHIVCAHRHAMPPSDFQAECPPPVDVLGAEVHGRDAPGSPGMNNLFSADSKLGHGARYTEKRITVDARTTLAVKFWGDEDAASACEPQHRYIGLHGFLDNAGTFDLLAPRMLERGAVAIACIDMSGHGWSDRRAPYRGLDWVVDVGKVADQLGWDKFSIVSHSLGGMTALSFASLAPARVCHMIVIEALGWMSQDAKGQLEMQAKAVAEAPKGKNIQTYPTLLACAQRRAEMNMVGTLPLDAAKILVQRGTKETENGFTWASDPACLATHREAPTEEYVQQMLAQVACPTLLVVADDGLWKKAALGGARLFTWRWHVTVPVFYLLGLLAHLLSHWFTLPQGFYAPGQRGAPAIRGLQLVYNLARRRLACKPMEVHSMVRGGHHPHLTQPDEVADAVSMWLGRVKL